MGRLASICYVLYPCSIISRNLVNCNSNDAGCRVWMMCPYCFCNRFEKLGASPNLKGYLRADYAFSPPRVETSYTRMAIDGGYQSSIQKMLGDHISYFDSRAIDKYVDDLCHGICLTRCAVFHISHYPAFRANPAAIFDSSVARGARLLRILQCLIAAPAALAKTRVNRSRVSLNSLFDNVFRQLSAGDDVPFSASSREAHAPGRGRSVIAPGCGLGAQPSEKLGLG